jgi:hypothetical protein|tara:strand:- start:438 stop:839 length:402 start_codon:yes stop_codon:yes gene_type:complete
MEQEKINITLQTMVLPSDMPSIKELYKNREDALKRMDETFLRDKRRMGLNGEMLPLPKTEAQDLYAHEIFNTMATCPCCSELHNANAVNIIGECNGIKIKADNDFYGQIHISKVNKDEYVKEYKNGRWNINKK